MISTYTRRYLYNTKIREGEQDWYLKDMTEELTDEQEALRQLNGLIESIATTNYTYSIDHFIADVKEAIEETNKEDYRFISSNLGSWE